MQNIIEFRRRVEKLEVENVRYCLMTLYLFCGRISEVVSKKCPSDKRTTPRGPRGEDARIDVYQAGETKHEAVVFTVRTAKRDGLERRVAVPLEFEPWAKPVYEYFRKHVGEPVFPFTQQYVRNVCYENRLFDSLQYYVYTYTAKGLKREGHYRRFNLHAIRHMRASELVEYYGFTGPELAIYGGWTFKTMGFPGATDRYLSLSWQLYFPKLLKKTVADVVQ
jgi:hypothetical protein